MWLKRQNLKKREKKCMTNPVTILCKSEKSDQRITGSGAPDSVSIVCLVHDTYHFSHMSDELSMQ